MHFRGTNNIAFSIIKALFLTSLYNYHFCFPVFFFFFFCVFFFFFFFLFFFFFWGGGGGGGGEGGLSIIIASLHKHI